MTGGFGGFTSLKFYKKLNIYKNSTGSCTFDPETMKAYSYQACIFRYVKGIPVFNRSRYSVTTSSHQSVIGDILDTKKIKPYTLYNSNIFLLGNSDESVVNELIMEQLNRLEYAKQIQSVPNKYFTQVTKDKWKDTSHIEAQLNEIVTMFKTKVTKEQREKARVYNEDKIKDIISQKDSERECNKKQKEAKVIDIGVYQIRNLLFPRWDQREEMERFRSDFDCIDYNTRFIMPFDTLMRYLGLTEKTKREIKILRKHGELCDKELTWNNPDFARLKELIVSKNVSKEVNDFVQEVA